VQIAGEQDHRTFYAYTPAGQRDDTNPAAHFSRIGLPLPPELADYIHSTPGQEDAEQYEPLALRPTDWPVAFEFATAVHLSPLSLCTHRHLPSFLKSRGVAQVTVDPGERYMTPDRAFYLPTFMPYLDAFLPSEEEVRTLFGPEIGLEAAMVRLAEWGARAVIVKNGADGVYVLPAGAHLPTHLPAFHQPGDTRVIDPTGAGDAFCGGFMVGLAKTGDPLWAARLGIISASMVIEGYGALYALEQGRLEAQRRLASLP
jgi:ribokinase